MYDAIAIIMIGAAAILSYLGRTSEDEYIRGLFSHSALAMMIAASNAARVMAVDSGLSANMIGTIWIVELAFMLLLLFSMFYMFYTYAKSALLKYRQVKSGEVDDVK